MTPLARITPKAAEVALAGRITAHRDMGKSMFIDIRDQSGRIQAYAQKNVLGDEQFHIFQHLDLGDFIGVKGTLFTTKTGEISVKIGGVAAAPSQPSGDEASPPPPFVILAKALRPAPAKWHGLEDTEIRLPPALSRFDREPRREERFSETQRHHS